MSQLKISPLRARMIEDMQLAGLAARTQTVYIAGVKALARYYRRSPDTLTEEEVRDFLVALRDRGVARGTFVTHLHGIKFLYRRTLGCDWPLFLKKRFASRGRSVCLWRSPTGRSATCLVG
jgi:integrase/recombinase XerD